MLNPFHDVNWHPGRRERRTFARSLVLGFPAVGLALLLAGRWQGSHWNVGLPLTVTVAGMALGLVLWARPSIARPFYVAWYGIACGLGFVLGNVLLTAVYFFVITPTGLWLRARGRDPLQRRFNRSARSYWRPAPKTNDIEQYYRQF